MDAADRPLDLESLQKQRVAEYTVDWDTGMLAARVIRLHLNTRAITCLFFFSSRRRHTRLQGDWSSDVCSSDLLLIGWIAYLRGSGRAALWCGIASIVLGATTVFMVGVEPLRMGFYLWELSFATMATAGWAMFARGR